MSVTRLQFAGLRRVRVYMLVRNSCTHDARVLKEADALSRRGFRVTIIAVVQRGEPQREGRQGFTIVRVPIAPTDTRLLRWVRAIPHVSTLLARRQRRQRLQRALKIRLHARQTRSRNAQRRSARTLHKRQLDEAQRRIAERSASEGQTDASSSAFFGRGRLVLPPTISERVRSGVQLWASERPWLAGLMLALRGQALRLRSKYTPGNDRRPLRRESGTADSVRLQRSRRQLDRLTRLDERLEHRAKRRDTALRRRPEERRIRHALANASRVVVRPLGRARSAFRTTAYEALRWSLLRAHRQFLLFDYSARALQVIADDLAMAEERGESGPIVIHAHDLNTLYPGTRGKVRFGAKLIYDSHELQLGTTGMTRRSRPHRWLYKVYERTLARRADAVITVCQSIAELLEQGYGLPPVEVVRNCPLLIPRMARHDLFRREFGISPETRVALYHGNLAVRRGLETLVESARYLDHVAIVLLGSGPLSETLPELAREQGVGDRIHVHPAVLQSVLPRYVASADVAVVPIQSFVPNYHYSLPNKLFESMMAGLPVAASHLPEIRRVVEDERVGAIFDPDDPRDTARAITEVLNSPDYALMCERAVVAARERHHWGCETERLVALYDRVLESEVVAGGEDQALRAA